MRICSLLPSAREIVFALGLGDRLVAVTHECDVPAGARRMPVITRSTMDGSARGSRDIHSHVSAAAHSPDNLFVEAVRTQLDRAASSGISPEELLTRSIVEGYGALALSALACHGRRGGKRKKGR